METQPETHPLLFTSCLMDSTGERTMRQLGKITTSSLLRYFFNGDILLWRNLPEPLYPVARVGLHEITTQNFSENSQSSPTSSELSEMKYQMALSIKEHSERYSWIIFADPGVIALRNWDHLFENSVADILISQGADGLALDSFLAVRAESYESFLSGWELARKTGIRSGNQLAAILSPTSLKTERFERGEVVRPFEGPIEVRDILNASVVDLSGGSSEEKTKLGFALHMMRTFGDKDGLFLDLMES